MCWLLLSSLYCDLSKAYFKIISWKHQQVFKYYMIMKTKLFCIYYNWMSISLQSLLYHLENVTIQALICPALKNIDMHIFNIISLFKHLCSTNRHFTYHKIIFKLLSAMKLCKLHKLHFILLLKLETTWKYKAVWCAFKNVRQQCEMCSLLFATWRLHINLPEKDGNCVGRVALMAFSALFLLGL